MSKRNKKESATYAWSHKGNYSKISSILFLNDPLPPLTPAQPHSEPGIQSASQPVECFFPGRILHFAWISSMTFVTGNNTQEAALSHSNCESDREVWDRVDLGFQSERLCPVLTGCKEMGWSHVFHILPPLSPPLLLRVSSPSPLPPPFAFSPHRFVKGTDRGARALRLGVNLFGTRET